MASFLMIIAAAIFLVLGSMHLLYTFRGPKLHPRDKDLITTMKQVPPVITRETDMWRAWIGFNASHSLGAMLYGLVYVYLAWQHPAFLFNEPFLLAFGWLFNVAFVILAKRYWFNIPLIGTCLALAANTAAIIVA